MLLQGTVSNKILLIRLLRMAKRLITMTILAMFTSVSTVLVAAQPLPELLSPRWSCSCSSSSSATVAASSLSSLLTWPSLTTRHICTNRLRPNHNQHHHHQSHHRHYRRRCHHPFLFFHLHFSPSNLLFYTTFILLISLVSNVSPTDNDIMDHLKSGNDNANFDSDNHYEPRNISVGHILNSNKNQFDNEEHVCGNIDIRNSVAQFKKLENCTVIEGYVQIVLLDNGTTKDFENITFPKLREITDYFLVFRIMGLQSLAKLFPNLSVIRGRTLLHNYAFVVYEMLQLQEIGLRSLTNIIRGDVRIEKNPNLCFVDTIDWSRIARNYLISGNMDPSACLNCRENCPVVSARRENGKSIGDAFNRVCWNNNICQKHSCSSDCERLNRTCSDSGECCPDQCIGGCVKTSNTSVKPLNQTCTACKNFVYQNSCYEQCPPNTFVYFNRRCVTKDECHSLSNKENEVYYKAFLNKCDSICPVGYTEHATDKHRCDHCGGDCPKVCQSSIVSNIASAQSLKGCTKINGSLEIYISSGGAQIVKELEENLKDLTEISEYLKIARSYPLITLNFLRNLKVIHGNKLERQKYSLSILDNPNLQDLWTFDNTSVGKQIQVLNGRIFFHINPKLCYNKIKNMFDYIDFKNWTKPILEESDVSKHTNGDKVPCEVAPLGVATWAIQSQVVGIRFENFKQQMEDPRSLLGYLIYFRETEHRNVSIFDGRDACSTSEWNVIEYDDIEGDDSKQNGTKTIDTIVPNLKPYTQYALYIKTYTIASETKGAESEIIYFKTMPNTPSQPRNLYAKATKHYEIMIKWDGPSKPNGEITHYKVRATKDELLINHRDRDYCSENIVKEQARVVIPSSESTAGIWQINGTNNTSSSKKDKEQCCSCKNEKIRPSDVEQSINFEDYIINTVYIKRNVLNLNATDTSEIIRRKRNIYLNTSNETDESSFTTEMTEFNRSSTSTTVETTTIAQKWNFMKEVNKTEISIQDLYHYTEYTIEVQACQNEANTTSNPCSVTAITSIRTLPLGAADDIDQRSITYTFDNSTNNDSKYKHINLKWDEPSNPNGFILSYQIEYKRVTAESTKQSFTSICVPRNNYEQNSYTLELSSGNHSIRIRARSLANFGNWTEPFHVFIEEPLNLTVMYIVITIFLAVVCTAITLVIFKLKQTRSKLDYVSVNPDYMSAGFAYEPDPKWEVARDKVTLIRELGQGSFGMVYHGELIENKEVIQCAIKTVNDGSSIRERMDFLKEADVMKSFTDCHHVVKLLGIVSVNQPVYVLMEIMSRGDLRKYLRDNRPDSEENPDSQPPTLEQLLKMAIEIADGMAYLASKKFVHRDLAARNCMVADDMTVKIGDFGMTRDIYETDYYRKGGKGLLPVRWMSPESLKDGIFTTYSDVWSYGVVLWEMATLASQPYQGLSNEEVLKFVVEGGRMSKPENCPDVLWNLMVHSWDRKPKARPTFLKIVEMLLDHIDKKPFLYLSFYNRWKNEHTTQNVEKVIEEKDESLIPLKPLSAVSDSDDEDSNSESSNGQLCEEDMDVKFFPLSRPVASQLKIFDEDNPEQTKENASDNLTNDQAKTLQDSNQRSDGSLIINVPTNSHNENFSLLNNNLSTSLANSESSSASNVNLEASTNKDPIISFAGFDTKKLNQSKETSLNVATNRSLINGHLINTSMV